MEDKCSIDFPSSLTATVYLTAGSCTASGCAFCAGLIWYMAKKHLQGSAATMQSLTIPSYAFFTRANPGAGFTRAEMCLGLIKSFCTLRNTLNCIFDLEIVSFGVVKLSFLHISTLVIYSRPYTILDCTFNSHIIYLARDWSAMV